MCVCVAIGRGMGRVVGGLRICKVEGTRVFFCGGDGDVVGGWGGYVQRLWTCDVQQSAPVSSRRPQRGIPRARRGRGAEEAFALPGSHALALVLSRWTRLARKTPLRGASNTHRLRVRRRAQLVAALHPHALQLPLDLRPALLPLLHLGEALAELCEFLLDARLLRCRADALELPLLGRLAEPEGEEVGVVALERGAGGDGDEGCRGWG